METMRRRLILIFSWLAAAVLTSVVASAAVAIADRQVSDRPLRPLTAAEVEALASSPIPPPIFTTAPEATVTTIVIIPEETDEANPTELDPASPDGEAQPFTGIDVEETEGAGPETVLVETKAEIVLLEGGTASIGGQVGQVLLLWALPRPGFTVEHHFDDTGLSVTFTDGRRQTWLVAAWDDEEGIIVETFEGPV
jgi:hypothetical protein